MHRMHSADRNCVMETGSAKMKTSEAMAYSMFKKLTRETKEALPLWKAIV